MVFSLRYRPIANLIAIRRIPSKKGKALFKDKRCCSLSAGLEHNTQQVSQTKQILQRIREKFQFDFKSYAQVVEGTGWHLGLPIKWKLTLGPNGAFFEHFNGERFSISWGSTGLPNLHTWEVDPSGICRSLEQDDLEACILTTWIRSGQWLNPKLSEYLHVELREDDGDDSTLCSPAVTPFESGIETQHNSEVDNTDEETSVQYTNNGIVNLAVRLAPGKVKVKLQVDTSTWLPVSMSQDVCGDEETWTFDTWKVWETTKFLYPLKLTHTAHSGGHNEYFTESTHPVILSEKDFLEPRYTFVPQDFEFEQGKSHTIQAWKTASCHILVKPLIDGKDVGYMILDTGASGLVMEKELANTLNLESFGELHVSGMAGKIPASFRKAKTLTLGPLTMKDPQFMEMEVPGLVTGPIQPVVGILGYDIFRRAVVEMKSVENNDSTQEGAEKGSNFLVTLYDIEKFKEVRPIQELQWLQLRMITNLPHVEATFSINGSDVLHGLFMLDTGAGGASVMFMSKAIDEFGLHGHLQEDIRTFVKGVGGSLGHRLPAKNGTLPWFQVGENKFTNVA